MSMALSMRTLLATDTQIPETVRARIASGDPDSARHLMTLGVNECEAEQPLWRIARHTAIYPKDKRLPDEVPLARQDFHDMAVVMEEHMKGRQFLVGESATVADLVAAYTLDWANEVHLLDASPELRGYMDRMYARPKAPPRIAEALASVRR